MSSEAETWLIYLAVISAFYLIPLLISSRAKRNENFAGGLVASLLGIVFLLISLLYPIGAGLVGPLSLADYLYALLVYLAPGFIVLMIWVSGLRLLGKAAPRGRSG